MGRFLVAVLAAACYAAVALADDALLRVNMGSDKNLDAISGLVNKNTVFHGNNVAISSTDLAATQNDHLKIQEVSDVPDDVTLMGEPEPIKEDFDGDDDTEALENFGFRQRFCWRRGFAGSVCGWRFPVNYWNRFGRLRFGRSCRFNRFHGGFFYC